MPRLLSQGKGLMYQNLIYLGEIKAKHFPEARLQSLPFAQGTGAKCKPVIVSRLIIMGARLILLMAGFKKAI